MGKGARQRARKEAAEERKRQKAFVESGGQPTALLNETEQADLAAGRSPHDADGLFRDAPQAQSNLRWQGDGLYHFKPYVAPRLIAVADEFPVLARLAKLRKKERERRERVEQARKELKGGD